MSLNLLDRIRRTFSFRLAFWYTTASLFTSIILFSLAYYSLSSFLENEDRELILSKFKEYTRAYQQGELVDLETLIDAERDSGKPILFFVRVASPDNSTRLLSLPDQWMGLDLKQIGYISIQKYNQQLSIEGKDFKTVFEITSFPLNDRNILQIGKDIKHREDLLSRFRQVFASVMIPAIFIGLIGGYFLTFRALQPIRNLTHTARAIIDTGRIEARVPIGRAKDELNELSMLFNSMLERIESLIKGMKEALDNVAHEIRTPLTRLRGIAENALQSDRDLEACQEALSDCLEESERIVRMMNTLMDISEAKSGILALAKTKIDVSERLEEVVELYRYIAEEKNITIHTVCSEDLTISGDPDRLQQVLGNVLDNAVKYTLQGGSVNVVARQEAGMVAIIIKDTGFGISQEDMPKIWDRLYRGDESRSQRGLGLGLSFVKSIVEIHGGFVEVQSEPGIGSTFSIFLPREA